MAGRPLDAVLGFRMITNHQLGKADVIVVLGAAVWPGGEPSPSLARRVRHAVDLFNVGVSSHILMTGGEGHHLPAEAVVMKQLALQAGVPESALVTEERSTSTFESAVKCLDIMRVSGWKSAIVVTDSYHLLRCVLLFRAFGVRASGSAATADRAATPLRRWIYYFLRECLGLPWYVLLILYSRLFRRI